MCEEIMASILFLSCSLSDYKSLYFHQTGSDVKSETKDEADEVYADTAANKAASDEKKIAATAAATAQCDGHNDEGKGSVAREELRVLGMKKAKVSTIHY